MGPKPKVLLLDTQSVQDSLSSIVPERIGEMLREQVGKDGRIKLMRPFVEIREQLKGTGHSSAAIMEAEGLYTSGIGLLTAGEDKKAAEAFQRAVDLMEENVGDLTNFDILTDALSNLSLAYFNSGFDADARKRMKSFAFLRPDAKLDPEKYSKKLRKLFEKDAKKVKSAGPGVLNITSSVPEALVFIDGVEKGKAPVKVTDVGLGYHYLVVRDGSGNVWSEKIKVRGRKKSQRFNVDFGEVSAKGSQESAAGLPAYYIDLMAGISTGSFGVDVVKPFFDLKPYLEEMGRQTGAGVIAWVAMFREGSQYVAAPFVYRLEDGVFASVDEVQFNIELSNLLVGVRSAATTMVDVVLDMPEENRVGGVELMPTPEKPVAVVVAPKKKEPKKVVVTPLKTESVVPPPDVAPSDESNSTTYLIAGGAVLAVGALVAGGLYYFLDEDAPQQANGFRTEVSW